MAASSSTAVVSRGRRRTSNKVMEVEKKSKVASSSEEEEVEKKPKRAAKKSRKKKAASSSEEEVEKVEKPKRAAKKSRKKKAASSSEEEEVEKEEKPKRASKKSDTNWQVTPFCRISTAIQGGPVWHKLRSSSDYITASRIAYAAGLSRFKTPKQFAFEHLTGAKPKVDKESQMRMDLGTRNEEKLRWSYSKLFGVTVEQVGLAVSTRDPRLACSPDGLVGDDGLVEFKYTKTLPEKGRQAALEAGFDPEWEVQDYGHIYPEYFCQIQQQLFVTGRSWCDFVVYSWQSKELLLERVPFRPKEWADISRRIDHFWESVLPKVKENLKHYRRKYKALYEES